MRGVMVYDVPGFYERVLDKLPVSGMSDVWLAHVPLSGSGRTIYNQRLKRILGVVLSLAALAILSPVMLFIALVIPDGLPRARLLPSTADRPEPGAVQPGQVSGP